MKKRHVRVMITFGVLVLLMAGLYSFTDFLSKVTGYFTGESEVERLVVCLNDNDAEFYGTTFCADCEKQVALFGTSFAKLHYVDCGREKELCPNIREIPAWYIDKQIYYGFKTIEELQELTNCQHPAAAPTIP